MDYKELYEQALERAKKFQDKESFAECNGNLVEYIFPELKESEDEKIIKEMKDFFSHIMLGQENFFREDYDLYAWIAWLEKQGEQTPADLKTKAGNWYICDMEVMNENMVTAFHRNEIYYCPKDGYLDVGGALFGVGCLDVFRLATEKEIPQPKQEWSKEDEKILDRVITNYESGYLPSVEKRDEIIKKLESFKERHTWKPSDEQIKVCKEVYADLLSAKGFDMGTINSELNRLEEQLKNQ